MATARDEVTQLNPRGRRGQYGSGKLGGARSHYWDGAWHMEGLGEGSWVSGFKAGEEVVKSWRWLGGEVYVCGFQTTFASSFRGRVGPLFWLSLSSRCVEIASALPAPPQCVFPFESGAGLFSPRFSLSLSQSEGEKRDPILRCPRQMLLRTTGPLPIGDLSISTDRSRAQPPDASAAESPLSCG